MLAFASLAVLALSAVSAAPVPTRRASAPSGWADSYLESYDVYHTRYVALGCASLKVNDFSAWDTCCHPLLAGESLSSRPSQCIPSDAASASAAGVTSEAAAAPTTTHKAKVAAAVQTTAASSSSSSDASVQSDAYATYFMQNGVAGACGDVSAESDHIVAIPQHWWGPSFGTQSQYCGKKVEITRVSDGAVVVATVKDACPSCVTDNSLDLSQGAFTSIATEAEGMVEITWKWQ